MTPKTLDKYIAALKKKAAAEGWSQFKYETELNVLKNEMAQQYLDDKITDSEYTKVMKQLNNAQKNPDLLGKAPAAQTQAKSMTHAEYISLWENLNKQKKAGKLTPEEYHAKGQILDQMMKQNATLAAAKTALGADPGAKATASTDDKLEKELKKIYGSAAKDVQKTLKELLDKHGAEIKNMENKMIMGSATQDEMDKLKLTILAKKILGEKIDQLTGTMLEANKKAMGMINGETLHVFAENANWQAYQLTQDTGLNLMFSVYDETAVKKLIREKPELLPRKTVNGKKDKAWNKNKIAGAVTQAILQGESIPKLARRIAAQTAETNMSAMMRYARTAMTGAQNSGRQEMLHQAKGMGIKCKKRWLATLGSRTRDAHAHLDGQTVDVDAPFMSDFGEIMFPGDLNSKGSVPANIYNCRCTLVYEYEGFPGDPTMDLRRDNETGQLIQDMNYDEWKAAKEGSELNNLNAAKALLAEAQKNVLKVKEDKVYSGIWKDDVTLADYQDKKGAIPAKRDYYTQEIAKFEQAKADGKDWATDEKIKALKKNLKLLNEFEKNGQLIEKRDAALKNLQDLYGKIGLNKTATAPAVAKAPAKKAQKGAKKAASASGGANTGTGGQKAAGLSLGAAGAMKTPFGPEAYSNDRLNNALWTSNKSKVDSVMRQRTGEVWEKATAEERHAIFEYTQSYSQFNEPLRGIEYGSNKYKGVGNTDLDAGYRHNGNRLNAMTDIIDKCSYDHDMWLQRGVGYKGMDKFFQVSENLLRTGTEKQLQNELLDKVVTEYGFMSMGSAKGQGFSGNILLNIYAPAGTKMMYAEPFSAYGNGSGKYWDGKASQSGYGHEFETIMQQGTQFRIAKVERTNGKIYMDLYVIGQDNQQRYKK